LDEPGALTAPSYAAKSVWRSRSRGDTLARTMIEFHLDPRSGVAPYLQIVQQVKEALRLGLLDVGDQLPTVREVVADLAINPNTVAKGYRELEASGLVEARPGRGTFVTGTLVAPSQKHHEALRRELERWLDSAERAGLDEESIRAVISTTLREAFVRRVA
jgi:GntR family transcriptional regulator